jgi:hypothetical protein
MAQPSEEDIDNVIAVTDFTDRRLIAAALKVAILSIRFMFLQGWPSC